MEALFQPAEPPALTFMRKPSDLHLKTFVAILIMILFGPLGNVLLGRGMKRVGAVVIRTPAEVSHVFMQVFTSISIWLGIASLIAFFLTYMLVLSWADYSFVQPASSASYGITALLAHFMLKEAVTPLRWIGVLVICLGVFMVSGTPPRTTDHF
jgi:drug/metabolite transporter (DMT)-like permease